MGRLKLFIAISIVIAAFGANAEIKNWDAIIAKATPQEKNDLGKVIQQIRMIPVKDPQSGKSVYKVMAVEKGSVFDREGIRVGDLVSAGSWGSSEKSMDLGNRKKAEPHSGNQ